MTHPTTHPIATDRPAVVPATDKQMDLIADLIAKRMAKRADGTYGDKTVAEVFAEREGGVAGYLERVRAGGKRAASITIDKLFAAPKVAKMPKFVSEFAYPDVPEGYYAVESRTGHNDLDFWRVDRPTEGKWAGRTFVKRVIGGHSDKNVRGGEAHDALEAIFAAGPINAAAVYGREIGQCGRCNHSLTDEVSRARGIGPHCWGLDGWHYDDTDILAALLRDAEVVGEEEA